MARSLVGLEFTHKNKGQEVTVKAVDFWPTPGGVSQRFTAGSEGARELDVFSPPREADKKAGAGFAAIS